MMSELLNESSKEWDKKLPVFLAEATKAATSAAEELCRSSEIRQNENLEKLNAKWEEKFQEILTEVRSDAKSTGGSTNGEFKGMGVGDHSYISRNMEIKGFVSDWSDPDPSSLTPDEARDYVKTKLLPFLKPEHARLLDITEFEENIDRRLFWTKIILPLTGVQNQKAAWSLRAALNSAIKDNALNINAKIPYAVPEPSPSRRPLHRQAGKFFGLLEHKGFDKGHFKIEYIDAVGKLKVRHAHGRQRALNIATWDSSMGWEFHEQNWLALTPNPGPTADALAHLV